LLTQAINEGFPKSKGDMPPEIASYWDFRDGLTSINGVVMYMDRVVPQAKLRKRITENVHSAQCQRHVFKGKSIGILARHHWRY
jgi:hypothetical protein